MIDTRVEEKKARREEERVRIIEERAFFSPKPVHPPKKKMNFKPKPNPTTPSPSSPSTAKQKQNPHQKRKCLNNLINWTVKTPRKFFCGLWHSVTKSQNRNRNQDRNQKGKGKEKEKEPITDMSSIPITAAAASAEPVSEGRSLPEVEVVAGVEVAARNEPGPEEVAKTPSPEQSQDSIPEPEGQGLKELRLVLTRQPKFFPIPRRQETAAPIICREPPILTPEMDLGNGVMEVREPVAPPLHPSWECVLAEEVLRRQATKMDEYAASVRSQRVAVVPRWWDRPTFTSEMGLRRAVAEARESIAPPLNQRWDLVPGLDEVRHEVRELQAFPAVIGSRRATAALIRSRERLIFISEMIMSQSIMEVSEPSAVVAEASPLEQSRDIIPRRVELPGRSGELLTRSAPIPCRAISQHHQKRVTESQIICRERSILTAGMNLRKSVAEAAYQIHLTTLRELRERLAQLRCEIRKLKQKVHAAETTVRTMRMLKKRRELSQAERKKRKATHARKTKEAKARLAQRRRYYNRVQGRGRDRAAIEAEIWHAFEDERNNAVERMERKRITRSTRDATSRASKLKRDLRRRCAKYKGTMVYDLAMGNYQIEHWEAEMVERANHLHYVARRIPPKIKQEHDIIALVRYISPPPPLFFCSLLF